MRYRFLTCDVFTARRFGGNQLAVLPDAGGLDTAADAEARRRVQLLGDDLRPAAERSREPGAGPHLHAQERDAVRRPSDRGHGAGPGVAWPHAAWRRVRASRRRPGRCRSGSPRTSEGRLAAEFTAPAAPSHSPAIEPAAVAHALGLAVDQIVVGAGLPCAASCGAPFLLVELASREALARAALGTRRRPPCRSRGRRVPVHARRGRCRGGSARPHVRAGARHPRGSRHRQRRRCAGGLPRRAARPRRRLARLADRPGRRDGPSQPDPRPRAAPGRQGQRR